MEGWTTKLGAVRWLTLLALLLAAGWMPKAASADDEDRFTILEENDSLYFNSDKHYTQGLRLSNLRPVLAPESPWNGPFDLLGRLSPIFAPDGSPAPRERRFAFLLGQSIFTPKDLRRDPPDPRDRPYAGWAYIGTSLLQQTERRQLENVEIDIGAVGPAALAKPVQNDWHQFIGKGKAQGWGNQLHDEPGMMISYERLWRVPLIGDGDSGVDVVPQAGATLGNVMTYGAAGAQLRLGKKLGADYGPVRIRPALSGTDQFAADTPDGAWGYYVFLGSQGRVVGRNVFLDGNTFRSSRHVEKNALVADLQAGFSVFWSSALRVDFSVVRRTEEFVGQRTPDEIGTAALAFSW
jgi:lipid A 3-O-deacylase